MKSKKAKTTISIVIVAILCLLLSTLFYSVYANRKMFENLKVQIDTRTVIITLKDNLSILLNAETGERGYVITGNANYLQPYTGARQQLNENMKMLDSMLHRDTNLLAELDSLEYYVNRKMSYIETVINLKKINDEKTIKALLNTGEGKELMDKARAHNLTLQAAEQVLFKERKNVADNSIRRTQIFFLSDGVFSLLIVLFLASVIINELNRRAKHEKKLKDYTVELQRKNEVSRVRALILLDMMGSKNLELGRDTMSTRWLQDIVWQTAKEAGYGKVFVERPEGVGGDDPRAAHDGDVRQPRHRRDRPADRHAERDGNDRNTPPRRRARPHRRPHHGRRS